MLPVRQRIYTGWRCLQQSLCSSDILHPAAQSGWQEYLPTHQVAPQQLTFLQAAPPLRSSKRCLSTAYPVENFVSDEQGQSPPEVTQMSAADQIENLDMKETRRLKRIQLEFDVNGATGTIMPEMNEERWLELLRECPTASSRQKKFAYWARTDKKSASAERKKAARRLLHEEKGPQRAKGEIISRIMHRVNEASINQHYYTNLAYAMQFGEKLVYDLSFDQHMTKKELIGVKQQMLVAHHHNKIHRDPFHLILTGCPPDHPIRQGQHVPFDRIPITVTEKHYLDFLPRSKLVYLSPNSPNILHKYSPDNIYIIGGIVDTAAKLPLTYAKAKREVIQTARLPLDLYLNWGLGHKCLTLDQMMAIMLEVKDSGDWNAALQFVPVRKLKQDDQDDGTNT